MSYMGQALAFLGHILATAKNLFKAMYVTSTQFTKLYGFFYSMLKSIRAKSNGEVRCHMPSLHTDGCCNGGLLSKQKLPASWP
jgi:hypothetical protein